MKTFCKIILLLIVLLSATFQFQSTSSHAASSKVGYVSISSGVLNVRNGPGSKYKVIGSLKNNASVSVYSQSKDGWSQIGYKKGKAYVSSQYLRMYSYLQDKTKIYTYKSEGKTYKHSYKGKWDKWDEWVTSSSNATYLVYEDSEGLYSGFRHSEYYIDLAYPLKVGKSWTIGYEGEDTSSKITALNGTLKTPAGTFKNVVTVKSSDGYVSYLAPNVGFIKGVDQGKTVSELVSLTKK
ncbi:SH3 domain-containing protein [Domibacillus sp. PGB-M46]|uniref:SH3 domain-containing protein n=1 Tax=Domibacillus sp. PGB-M46 TaxID=2910255 RepID=UPI001F5999BD|nr:SH3 domain-containing protein [Domibacillus sp. PGB-M46]MCI2256518.1 SH3 domain-containing protein [Domibacillus sp. PGB-M46]